MKKMRYAYIYLALGLIGVVGGALWWNFYGCTDSCPINSKVHWMMLRGGIVGLCVAAIFQSSKPKAQREVNSTETGSEG